MTHYIPRPHFDSSFPFPALVKDCRTTVLLLEVEDADEQHKHQTAFLDGWINRVQGAGSPYSFSPIRGMPVLCLLNEGRLGVEDPNHAGRWAPPGWSTYREIAFALPVRPSRAVPTSPRAPSVARMAASASHGAPGPSGTTSSPPTGARTPAPSGGDPQPVVFLLPFIFADVHPAVATGREGWGYEKVQASVSLGQDRFGPSHGTASALAWKTTGPGEEGISRTLVRAERVGFGFSVSGTRLLDSLRVLGRGVSAASAARWAGSSGGSCGGILDDWVEFDRAVDLIADGLLRLQVGLDLPIINLKQIRRTADSEQADHQSLVLTEFAVQPGWKLERLWLPYSWRVHIPYLQSAQIAQCLGLNGRRSDFVGRATVAFTASYDVRLPAGKAVWP